MQIGLVLGALLALAFVVLVLVIRSWLRAARARSRMTRAQAGERGAVALFEAYGLRVVGTQVAIEYPIEVDGETVMVPLRADYVVRDPKTRARYVAEVKTGALAPRIDTAATRRQLLEYEIAFDVDGVLLVDAEARAIHSVAFPTSSRAQSRRR